MSGPSRTGRHRQPWCPQHASRGHGRDEQTGPVLSGAAGRWSAGGTCSGPCRGAGRPLPRAVGRLLAAADRRAATIAADEAVGRLQFTKLDRGPPPARPPIGRRWCDVTGWRVESWLAKRRGRERSDRRGPRRAREPTDPRGRGGGAHAVWRWSAAHPPSGADDSPAAAELWRRPWQVTWARTAGGGRSGTAACHVGRSSRGRGSPEHCRWWEAAALTAPNHRNWTSPNRDARERVPSW